jgi:type IX secretion system PorP/SprF family membrane protein
MIKHFYRLLILFLLLPDAIFAQDIDVGPGFQFMMINNPSLAGSEGDGLLRLSYLNLYPGNNFNLHSVYLSYDSYFPDLHGGAGFYLINDYLGGIVNDINGGVSYAYNLQAGEDLFINAGLSASIYHRGYNFGKAVFPDQIDPLGGVIYPSSQLLSGEGKTVFDLGAGILFISGKFFGGFSVSHLTEPDLSVTTSSNDNLKRELLFHIAGDFDLSEAKDVSINPLVYIRIQDNCFFAGAGASLESKYMSINALMLGSNNRDVNIQTGFSVMTGKISINYNYRFNIKSANLSLPLSLIHQTGIAIGLNNVDKRKLIKTINYPKL